MQRMRFWLGANEAVLVITLILLVIGAVNIFSASFVLAAELMNNSYFFLLQHIKAFAIGLAGFALIISIGYRRLVALTPLLILATVALLVAVFIFGEDANGAKRWLRIGIKFQPSELAKLTVIILTSVYLGARLEKKLPITLFSMPMYISLGLGFLVLRQPDMGTASVIVGLCVAMYLVAGIPRREIYGLVFGGTAALVYLALAASYRADRIWAWLDPWNYQQGIGYQSVQALLAIGSGGFLGAGFGKGASKFYYLPEAHTDFAFAVLCQEMGFVGAFIVLILLGGLGFYGLKIALSARERQGMMLATGAVILIVGQAVGNIAMVCGILPVAGVPLPFISYGGTSLIVNISTLALLISVGRLCRQPFAEEEQPAERPNRPRLSLVTSPVSETARKRE